MQSESEDKEFDYDSLNEPRLAGWYPERRLLVPERAKVEFLRAMEIDEGEAFDDAITLLGEFNIHVDDETYLWQDTFKRRAPVTVRLLTHAARYLIWLLNENDPEKLLSALKEYALAEVKTQKENLINSEQPSITIHAFDKDGWPLNIEIEHAGLTLKIEQLRQAVSAVLGYRTVRKIMGDVPFNLRSQIEEAVGEIAADAFEAGRAFRQAELKATQQKDALLGKQRRKDAQKGGGHNRKWVVVAKPYKEKFPNLSKSSLAREICNDYPDADFGTVMRGITPLFPTKASGSA